MSKKTDFEVMGEMSKNNMDIRMSPHFVGGRKVKQGAILETGVEESVLMDLMTSDKYLVVTYIVNKEQFFKLKGQ